MSRLFAINHDYQESLTPEPDYAVASREDGKGSCPKAKSPEAAPLYISPSLSDGFCRSNVAAEIWREQIERKIPVAFFHPLSVSREWRGRAGRSRLVRRWCDGPGRARRAAPGRLGAGLLQELLQGRRRPASAWGRARRAEAATGAERDRR